MSLRASAVELSALRPEEVERMYALYAASYCDTAWGQFGRDLDDKTHCIVLRSADDVIQGFSTLKHYTTRWNGSAIRVIFSGDTIVDPAHWGSQQLAFAWIRHAGEIWREAPDLPLFWFLIVKGHRTYRYLRAFARDYAPRADVQTNDAARALMDHLATERYGRAYDCTTGLLAFDEPQGRLMPALAEIPVAHRTLPEVDYFLKRNPRYARGDELVCLCELKASNLRPLARRLFEAH
ncbi:MAG: hypothetical protein LBV73_13350 [Paraburkholderia sp.]|jgi:hypothetical protein|nr:hypothetical protein [Paraburkholderia sp.]